MHDNLAYIFKIIIVGEGGVGKTTMIRRLCFGQYLPQKMTIGTDLSTYDLTVGNLKCKLQLWDFAGEKRFRFFLPSYCRGAVGCLFVFDLVRYSTFKKLEEWYEIIDKNTQDIISVLVGSKLDLAKERGAVNFEEVLEFQKTHNINSYLETSSKTGENNNELFELITRKIIEKKDLK
jgi:small GTP-binding protein